MDRFQVRSVMVGGVLSVSVGGLKIVAGVMMDTPTISYERIVASTVRGRVNSARSCASAARLRMTSNTRMVTPLLGALIEQAVGTPDADVAPARRAVHIGHVDVGPAESRG